RFFNDLDLLEGRAVGLIGATVRKALFKNENPIGKKLRLGQTSIVVIGLLGEKGQTGFGQDQDDTIIVPITTLHRRLTGQLSKQNIDQIMISGEDGYPTESIVADITSLMR